MRQDGYQSSNDQRDPMLGRLLASIETPDVLPWPEAARLVAAAPPVRVPWYSFLTGSAPMLRYSACLALVLLLGTGVLAVVPAQSQYVGTIISTELPSAWQPGSPQMAELESAARSTLDGYAGQGQLYLLDVRQADGRPKLAIALPNFDDKSALRYYADLAGRYPALKAFPSEVEPVENETGSLLSAVLSRAFSPSHLTGLSEDQARVEILHGLRQMGLSPTSIQTTKQPDGTLVIDVNATMEIHVPGHTQEDLRHVGLSRELLGDRAYEQLLDAAAH